MMGKHMFVLLFINLKWQTYTSLRKCLEHFFVEMVVNGNTFFNHRILSFCLSIYMYGIDWLIVNRSTG